MSEPDYLTVYLYAHEMARKDIVKLKDEIARLKAEVESLMTNPTSRLLRAKQAENTVLAIENDSLKAEVDALTTINSTLTLRNNSLVDMLDGCEKEFETLDKENASLKAEVERLKAVSTIEQRTIQGLQQTPEWSEIARLTADYRKLEADLRNCRTAIVVKDAEKERLRKAGDELERVLTDRSGSYEAGNASYEWKSAKNYK